MCPLHSIGVREYLLRHGSLVNPLQMTGNLFSDVEVGWNPVLNETIPPSVLSGDRALTGGIPVVARIAVAPLFFFLGMAGVSAQSPFIEMNGQLSGWIAGSLDGGSVTQVGARYIPDLRAGCPLSESLMLDCEVSAHGYGSFRRGNAPEWEVEAHRLWLRVAAERAELRAGLQKINFGSAVLLRPLMWFDGIDPRDPLKLTAGVYGLLGRYVFQDNSNIWLWTLYGNRGVKGIETDETIRNTPEFGGRAQMPLGPGEAALSYHHRRIRVSAAALSVPQTESREHRLGLDGRWDLGVGVWCEGAVMNREEAPDRWITLATVGAAYTFAWGNGVAVTCAHFVANAGRFLTASRQAAGMTALAAEYPLDAVHGVSLMAFYDWRSREWYRIAGLSHTQDAWSAHLLLYINPERNMQGYPGTAGPAFAGTGFHLLAAFYH